MVAEKERSAGVVVVHRDGERWLYLVLRAYRNWDFPKGLVEAGESPLETAIRETEEETNIEELQFAWGHDYRETSPYRAGKVARYYLAQSPCQAVTLSVCPELGRPEHHEYRWVPYDLARQLLPERLLPILEWARGVIEAS